MKLLIATSNKGKLEEIKTQLGSLPLQILSLNDVSVDDSTLVEDGNTFQENAEKKARFYSERSGLPTLADDSGLIVEALQGELGLKTRRWGAGEKVSDQEWLNFFMKRMEKESNRNALFVCAACLVNDNKILTTAYGEVRGIITKSIEAPIKPGIPLSSVFKPNGCNKVQSSMSIEEKNQFSHRGRAIEQIKIFLQNYHS